MVQINEYYNVVIEDIRSITPVLKLFTIRYPMPVLYKSGQFVIIDFGNLNHHFSTRSYSISDFTQNDTLELCVVLKEDGAATPLMFKNQIGDTLKASLPQGRFVLPDAPDENQIFGFICTGTGVAPFRAMIKDLLIHRGFKGRIFLFFGCRFQTDMLYREEFETLSSQFPNFNYIPVLSREQWEGKSGYVHEYYKPVFESKPDAMLYLCGWTGMLKETRENLKSFGYTRNEIKIEFYD